MGIDIGTSAVKTVILDQAGDIVGEAKAALPISRPQDLWSEQDPADWWVATDRAVSALPAVLRRRVGAIGLTGQMHGATLLDADDRTLRPAILWNDGRSARECVELTDKVPEMGRITGNLAMPGFTAPKLLWVRRHQPALWDRLATVLLPKDFIRLRMTGEKATDLSDASGTLWLDVGRRRWSETMLAACGLAIGQMPALHEGNDIAGRLRREVAQGWGMDSVPVAAGAGDNAASAVGIGVVHSGDALLSLGTSGVLFVATDRFRPNPALALHAFCHCLPERWHQMSVTLSAAACIDWVARLTRLVDAASLFAALEQSGRSQCDEIFLPYLSGERTPYNDPNAKGVFFGLTPLTDPTAAGMAVLEGVAMAIADGFEALTQAGTKVDSITVVGGGARSPFWGRILASAVNRPLVYRRGAEMGPAAGAARLARLALTQEPVLQVCSAPPITHVIEPQDHLVARLSAKRRKAARLYAGVKDLFREPPHV